MYSDDTATASGEIDDSHCDVDAYAHFDEDAYGLLVLNDEALRRQAEIDQAEVALIEPVDIRFDVVTSTDRLGVESTSVINLKTAIEHAIAQRGDKVDLSSSTYKCVYVKEIFVESAVNTLPVGVQVHCSQGARPIGTYMRAINEKEQAGKCVDPCLFVAHAHSQYHSDSGRRVHTVSNAVNGSDFKTYREILKHDIEDYATHSKVVRSVEYTSPWSVVRGNEVAKGDPIMHVFYMNPVGFNHCVNGVKSEMVDESGEVATVISLRLHTDDWANANEFLQTRILGPLRDSVVDLDVNPMLRFTLLPDVAKQGDTKGSSSIGSNRTASIPWSHESVCNSAGQCALSLRAVVAFV
jgi:hypothetical protein